MKDVLVTVKTVQTDDSGKPDTIELTAEGSFAKKDDAYLIKYTDCFLAGADEPILTTVRVGSDGSVTVSRSGKFKSRFTIEKGRRCQCMYATPYGTLSMGFFGESIESRLTENGGEIKLTCTVDVNNSQMNKNEMTICIKDVQF